MASVENEKPGIIIPIPHKNPLKNKIIVNHLKQYIQKNDDSFIISFKLQRIKMEEILWPI